MATTTPLKPMAGEKAKQALVLLLGSCAGLAAYGLLEVLRADPKALLALLGSWGPLFVVLLVAMWFGNQRMGEWLEVLRDNTKAQQDLAGAVQQIAQKDDRAAQAEQLMLGYVGQQLDKVLMKLETMEAAQARRG